MIPDNLDKLINSDKVKRLFQELLNRHFNTIQKMALKQAYEKATSEEFLEDVKKTFLPLLESQESHDFLGDLVQEALKASYRESFISSDEQNIIIKIKGNRITAGFEPGFDKPETNQQKVACLIVPGLKEVINNLDEVKK